MDSHTKVEVLEVERIEVNRKKSHIYYKANKDRIQERREQAQTVKNEQICEKRSLPIFIAKYVKFHENNIILSFKTEKDLLKFIENILNNKDITLETIKPYIEARKTKDEIKDVRI